MEFLKVKPPWVDYFKETVSIICQRYTADTPVRVWNCSLQMLCKKNEPVSHVNERVGGTKGCSRNHKYSVFVFMIPHPIHTHTHTHSCVWLCRCPRLPQIWKTSVCKTPPRILSWWASPPVIIPSDPPSPAPCSEVGLLAPSWRFHLVGV